MSNADAALQRIVMTNRQWSCTSAVAHLMTQRILKRLLLGYAIWYTRVGAARKYNRLLRTRFSGYWTAVPSRLSTGQLLPRSPILTSFFLLADLHNRKKNY